MAHHHELHRSDQYARYFLALALGYLLFGLLLGTIGGFQYILPDFLKHKLSFQQTRPLHVYLVISWIFTAAQAGLYYYVPRVANRPLYWLQGIKLHLVLQVAVSLLIITGYFFGKFGGREYLEFPPALGILIFASWIPFAVNFFCTLKPSYRKAPVYVWMWSTGILFFFITLSESYLWLFDHFRNNIVRDVTVQWKALGSMVGSWNMLVYGTGIYVMEKTSNDERPARSTEAFLFYFLGLTNLMFNWGHHTYIVPAAPWVKTVAYTISMTELIILAHLIMQWRKTMTRAKKNYHLIPYRLLTYADVWIVLNLVLAIIISVPAWNYYTHGTHITVAHAMGAMIGINTMILFASIFYRISQEHPGYNSKYITAGILITNVSLLVFWISLLGSGLVRISGSLKGLHFAAIMNRSALYFKAFAFSGVLVMAGLVILVVSAARILVAGRQTRPFADLSKISLGSDK